MIAAVSQIAKWRNKFSDNPGDVEIAAARESRAECLYTEQLPLASWTFWWRQCREGAEQGSKSLGSQSRGKVSKFEKDATHKSTPPVPACWD